MDINNIYQEIGTAKKEGKFHAVISTLSIDRNILINKLRHDKFIIIEIPGKLIVTWIGCKEWADIKGFQYDRIHVMDEAFKEIMDVVKQESNSTISRIRFLNPSIMAFMESKYNKSTGEVESSLRREESIKNQLFSTINKF